MIYYNSRKNIICNLHTKTLNPTVVITEEPNESAENSDENETTVYLLNENFDQESPGEETDSAEEGEKQNCESDVQDSDPEYDPADYQVML